MNETNEWIRVQKHPILKCGAITIENKQVNVMALCVTIRKANMLLEERMIGLIGSLLSIFREKY